MRGLTQLPFEEALLPSIVPLQTPVEPKALAMYVKAREECLEMFKNFTDLTMVDVAKLMEKRSQRLCQLDSSFVIEIAVAKKLASSAGAALVESRIMKLLPAVRKRVSLEQLVGKLQKLQGCELVTLLPRSASTVVETVLQVLLLSHPHVHVFRIKALHTPGLCVPTFREGWVLAVCERPGDSGRVCQVHVHGLVTLRQCRA